MFPPQVGPLETAGKTIPAIPPTGLRHARRGRHHASIWLACLICAQTLAAQSGGAARVSFPGSIREIPFTPQAAALPAGRPQPRITHPTLTAAESAAPMEFELALRMRNFADLQARISRGEIIPRAEMAAKYFPQAADYQRVIAWLKAEGFAVTYQDDTHLGVFARGPVSRVASVFETQFARVSYEGGEFTSAISAPSVPTALAPALLGINGLQPHLRAHKLQFLPQAVLNAPYTPSQILHAYDASGTGLDGTGQTVATVIDTFPNDSDLTAFWNRYNIPESLANVTKIQVISGSLPTPSGEESVDVEWSTAMAPGVKVRVYATTHLYPSYFDQAYQRIYSDLASVPSLHQVMLCFGQGESDISNDQLLAEAQNLAALASAGVTVLASSGDGGSNPDSTGQYSASATTQVFYPAGDPSVTAIGGTTLTLDSANGGTISSETAWSGSGGGSGATGLSFLARPSWQTGPGVPTGTGRLVPDVSATADPTLGILISLNGQWVQGGGTSVSAPIWAGFCALLNQARALAGQGPLGQLGPSIYPMIGTANFHDITSGSNGAYSCTPGYDMVTGIGTPDVAMLMQNLVANFAPVITAQPASRTATAAEDATFSVTANGNPLPTFQWESRAVGTTTWDNVTEGTTYTGVTTTTLTVHSVTEAMSGDTFRCLVTNANGTATSEAATLLVPKPLTITTLAGSAGASGSADGTGAAARFWGPSDLAADASGNLYIADTNNDTIRKITSAGVVTTLAGAAGVSGSADGDGSAARFDSPAGITVDGNGNLYVADTDNDTIRKITADGSVTTVAGTAGLSGSADGNGTAARFNHPSDVTADGSGNLYVADADNDTIRKITSARDVTTLAGTALQAGSADGTGTAARFDTPMGVTVDGSGNLYVADSNNNTIRKVTPSGQVTTLAGLAGTSGDSDGAGSAARFSAPSDLAVAATGNLYVADMDNQTIRMVTPAGLAATVAGLAGASGSSDGTGSSARFLFPAGVTVGTDGTVYVADTNNNTIRTGQVEAPPQITTQPQSISVTAGNNASFSVTATGAPTPTYQWNKNGTAISGATASTLTLSDVQTADAGNYTVTVSNLAGSVTSSTATLTVTTPAPPPSSGGGGGGGGALPAWFVLALALLGAARWTAGRRLRAARR